LNFLSVLTFRRILVRGSWAFGPGKPVTYRWDSIRAASGSTSPLWTSDIIVGLPGVVVVLCCPRLWPKASYASISHKINTILFRMLFEWCILMSWPPHYLLCLLKKENIEILFLVIIIIYQPYNDTTTT